MTPSAVGPLDQHNILTAAARQYKNGGLFENINKFLVLKIAFMFYE